MGSIASNPLEERVKGIQKTLIALYDSSCNQSNHIKGIEREFFLKMFLQKIFPPTLRISQGMILDYRKETTGELDLVLETPTGFSVPTLLGESRVFLSETVGGVIEVKSNLTTQWSQIARKIEEVKKIKAGYSPVRINGEERNEQIPMYIVGYKWDTNYDALLKRIEQLEVKPDGVLILENGYYWGKLNKMIYYCPNSESIRGYLMFIMHVLENFKRRASNGFSNLDSYLSGNFFTLK